MDARYDHRSTSFNQLAKAAFGFNETINSAPGADPEIIEATATVVGGSSTNAFVHLRVE